MWPAETMQARIKNKRYRVAGSILLAHDHYWDGWSFERAGCNTFLYCDRNGRLFAVRMTQWAGERNRIEPLSLSEAVDLYASLPVKEIRPEDVFSPAMMEALRS
jgi:hypothetical protein